MEALIFNFNDTKALQVQDAGVCQHLYDHFWKTIEECEESPYLPKEKLAELKKNAPRLHWLPAYAGVVFFQAIDSLDSAVRLIGLDGWESAVHASIHGRESIALPDVRNPAVFELGIVPTEKIDEILEDFERVRLSSESDNTGNQRSQRKGHQGNQKTPSFARTLLWQVIRKTKGAVLSQGGSTDVGLHTGCIRRSTSFPLMLSGFYIMLRHGGEGSSEVFNKCVSSYLLSFLKEIVPRIMVYDARLIDRSIIIAREVGFYLKDVEDDPFRGIVIDCLEKCKKKLEDLEPGIQDDVPELVTEPVSQQFAALNAPKFPPIPSLFDKDDMGSLLERARADAKDNLDWSDINVSSLSPSCLQDAWVQLSRLNCFFWDVAVHLDDKKAEFDMDNLLQKLDLLTSASNFAHKKSLDVPHMMSVVLPSCKLLATWICFCWSHRVAEEQHAVFNNCGAALDFKDLKHIVLDDARAIKAVECIRVFLKARNGSYRPFRTKKDTVSLALTYGRSNPAFNQTFCDELRTANNLIEQRWKKVKDTQDKLVDLKRRLATAVYDLSRAEENKRVSNINDCYYVEVYRNRKEKRMSAAYYEIERKEADCKRVVESLRIETACLEQQKPPVLLLGLPRDKDTALRWLFFLFMPKEFQDLSKIAHTAQSLLWTKVPPSPPLVQNLQSWFNSYRRVSAESLGPMKLKLESQAAQPRINLPRIQDFARETGVFFPCSFSIDPNWKDVDPFSKIPPHDETVRLFTEVLPMVVDESNYMQQFLSMLPTKQKENTGIALRERKPSWLSEEGYVAFTTMRVGPNGQIRQLVRAFVEDILPFSHGCVHILIQQLLFHIGDEEWKTDLRDSWGGLTLLARQMTRMVALVRESPKDADKLLVFGVISSFLGQFDRDCLSCARNFSYVARGWADNIWSALVQNHEQVSAEIYWKQAKSYGYALLCHSVGRREDSDYLEMAELVVLFKSKQLFSSSEEESQSIDQCILKVMTYRITNVLDVVGRHLQHLSRCLSLVIDGVPNGLKWVPVVYDNAKTGCFEAFSDHLYSINLLNGTVLVDGVPPGFLPSLVVKDSLYTRTFGGRNFESVILGFRHYRSARLVDGQFLYEFVIDKSGNLQILEHDTLKGAFSFGFKHKLLLLRRETMSLPVRLREKHSHWYSTTHQKIFVRRPRHSERRIEYVVSSHASSIVPFKSQLLSHEIILKEIPECDSLLLGGTRFSRALEKFELKDFIHITCTASKAVLRYSLPRFDLVFEHTETGIRSLEFKGFDIERMQLLDSMPGLVSCISLFSSGSGSRKVLIPDGVVTSGAKVLIANNWDATLLYHIYDVHPRFRHLVAMDTIGRLHLAGLYASCASYTPDKRLGKPGSVVAAELLRQSWKNEPLTTPETKKLVEVSKLSSLSCTLRLMCSWVWRSSNAMFFLHAGDAEPTHVSFLEVDPVASDEYRRNIYAPRLNEAEELFLLGTTQPAKPVVPALIVNQATAAFSYVHKVEFDVLPKYLISDLKSAREARFPLKRPKTCRGLELHIYEDLEDSYSIFCQLPARNLTCFNNASFLRGLDSIIKRTEKLRHSAEGSTLKKLADGNGSADFRLRKMLGEIGKATPLDLLPMTWDDSIISLFHPYLSAESRTELRVKIIDWEMLCVLQDKLRRIQLAYGNVQSHLLIAELECVRKWEPYMHPRWLAFEVEQMLQIRPYQYNIVQQLLGNPNSMVQLNMGLGKTRVLVPMIVLHLMSQASIGRLNILPSIIQEATDYYRQILVASTQHVKLFVLPFQRDLPLDERRARQISAEIQRCKEFQGFFLVSPQHRNSLLLKQHDVEIHVAGLKNEFLDVIDESDAVLDYNYQLVYALGEQHPLPGGMARWTMFQTFLRIIGRGNCADSKAIMSDSSLVHKESDQFGSFPKIRVLSPFRQYQSQVGEILARCLIAEPPHELRWMILIPTDKIDLLVWIISDPKCEEVGASIKSFPLFLKFQNDILAARGCIAYGLLFHCLAMRYRVNYGLRGDSKLMAVPFSASDTPKLRAEFSHPDSAIVYSCLSYLHEGLSKDQLKEALVHLQSTGPESQRVIYEGWICSVKNDVDEQELEEVDNILKVDISNTVQLDIMHKNLRYCMEVIFYWLNNFVFPRETFQFPARRASSAWNLVDSGSAIGFSGTDDNRFLLPLCVSQRRLEDNELLATNGAMIDRILSCTREKIELLTDRDGSVPLWETVLHMCMSCQTHALIDVSGQMAGVQNKDAAVFFAKHVHEGLFRGFVYFDTECRCWNVYEFDSRRILAIERSSVTEAECFVYFDESRCRGSDKKLMDKAVALVTLEPKITKDKFLQGCARMRKLSPNCQSLILAGTSEVVSAQSTAKDILEMIVENTVVMTRKGIVTFHERGSEYYSFPKPIEEDVTLDAMYKGPLSDYDDIRHFLEAKHETVELSRGVRKLVDHCSSIGEGLQAHYGKLSEECEREVEEEVEIQEEEEIELPRQIPYTQIDWEFAVAFSSPKELFGNLFKPLTAFINSNLQNIAQIQWSKKLFCTENFWRTIQQSNSTKDFSMYLRPVDGMLVMPDGRVVLISAYEADNLLPYWWNVTTPKCMLRHLFTSVSEHGFGREDIGVSTEVLTSVKLFRGYVQFSKEEIIELKKMFRGLSRGLLITELLFMRGRLKYFDRSDLDDFAVLSEN